MYNIGNFLIKLKNAQKSKKEDIIFPFSKNIYHISQMLVKNNFLAEVLKKEKNGKKYLKIKLLYKDGNPLINDVKLISKPSRRIYVGYKDIKSVKQGYGIGIISTSKGILNDKEARKEKIGGEYIAEIW